MCQKILYFREFSVLLSNIYGRNKDFVNFVLMQKNAFILGLVIFMLGCGFSGISQDNFRYNYYDEDKLKVKEKIPFREGDPNIAEGDYMSYFINGKPESKGEYFNNEAVGNWEFYYENGNLKMKLEIEDDDVGYWEYFYENGHRSREGVIGDKMKQGEWRIYYESGKLKGEGAYINDKMERLWHFYNEDGKLTGEIDYTINKGKYSEYYSTGELKAEGPRSGFNNVGKWIYYYKPIHESEEKRVQAEGMFVNGEKDGLWVYYYPDEKIAAKGNYKNGEPDGEWEYFYEDGKLSSKGIFEDGRKNGVWNVFYPDGKLRGQGEFVNGTGDYIEYYKNKNVKVKGHVAHGNNHGEWKYYYHSGELEGECDFDNGRGMYMGYFPDGTLKTKGVILDDRRIGTWELYKNDGSLSGYYKPFYEDDGFSSEIMTIQPVEEQESQEKKHGIADYKYKSRGSRHFKHKVNEFHGIILGANPLLTFVGKVPFAMEFYMQERLGYEFEFEAIRDPFFKRDSLMSISSESAPDIYTRGYKASVRQKFYSPHRKLGLWYWGHELQYANLIHFANVLLTEIQINTPLTTNAREQLFMYNAFIGYRIMESTYRQGFTIDMLIGAGIGYRMFANDDQFSHIFQVIPQGPVAIIPRFGINFGYNFSFGKWR